ncbi:MAG: hypothetical protein MZV64_06510 [Ignavibacteriales bacterium]|nr:hypothetical protein [Ignavibacteriales bacterium]
MLSETKSRLREKVTGSSRSTNAIYISFQSSGAAMVFGAKEVWKTIEEHWALNERGELNGFLSLYDESYLGWNYNSEVPRDYSTVIKRIKYFFSE